MRTLSSISLAVALLAVCVSVPAADVTLNPSQRYQTIDGWGTCLVDWNSDMRDLYRTDAWREAYRDLGMNILRVAMVKEVLVHDTDYSIPIELGPDLQSNINLMDFTKPSPKIFGETAAWLAQNALEPERVKISGSPWSPPHWMKGPTGNSQNFVGVTDDYPTPWLSNQHVPWNVQHPNTGASIGGRLKTEDAWTMEQYGRYMAAWTKGFEQEYGVPFHVVSLQNESTFENPFDSMTFVIDENGNRDFTQYAMGLKAVKDAWEQHGLDTSVMGPHVAHLNDSPNNPYGLWWQDEMIAGVKNHSDPELADFLDYYNANGYTGNKEGNVKNIAGFYHGADDVVPGEWTWHSPPGVEEDGKGIWFSEAGGGQAAWVNGSGDAGNGAIIVAQKIHNHLVHADASAYIYWQMTDQNSGETTHTLLGQNHINDPSQSNKYNAYKQFSRYVRPGAERIDAVFDNGLTSVGGASEYDTYNSLNVSAYVHDEDGTVTIVLVNMKDTSEPLTIDVSSLPNVPAYDVYRSSGTEQFAQLSSLNPVGGNLSFAIPGFSVMTLHGLVLPSDPGDLNHDGTIDAADIDLMFDLIHAGTNDPIADLNGDGVVDQADADELVRNILNTEYGDTTLDGKVDAGDLSLLASNWQHCPNTWAQGDFDGSGCVNAADLSLLAAYWQWERPSGDPVPEPAALLLATAGVGALLKRRRRS